MRMACPRCGGGPGEPGCGKTIHETMDRIAAEAANRRKAARRKAERSPAAQEARRNAPRDASGPRGKGRGGARAAEAAGRRDPERIAEMKRIREWERAEWKEATK